jgi:cytidylate kinase
MERSNITIDGPAGAGKSTVAKLVADKLSYIYLDTGAMYRTLTYLAQQNNISLEDEESLVQLAKILNFRFEWGIDRQKVFCNDQDITSQIRTPIVSNAVSVLARHPKVREQMVTLQRKIAVGKGVVLDGRDTGTFVLPEAEYKFFLTASVGKRAERRTKELIDQGHQADLETIKAEIKKRDKNDSERAVAPLKVAPDAIIIDTSDLSIQQVVDKIIQFVSNEKAGI